MTKNKKAHIMLNEKKIMQKQCMNNAQISYKGCTNKKYQFLNYPMSTCTI